MTTGRDVLGAPRTDAPARDAGAHRLGHVEALDGIRAVAVVGVLLFHGGIGWLPGGFLGVDVFFVLSGFLITSLLLTEVSSTGRVALGTFWMRRIRRLLPALLLVVAVVVAVPWFISPDRPLSAIRIDAGAALAYVANWRFVLSEGSYFERTGAPSPLLHTWSLAVEEQFYLVWPIVVALLARRGGRRAIGIAASVAAVASAVGMALLFDAGSGSSRAYYGSDARVHVILVGAVLAVVLAGLRGRGGLAAGAHVPLTLAAIAACGGIGAAMVIARGDDAWLYRGGFGAVALATALVIAAVVLVPINPVARVLSIPPLPALGRISYGVYLWHWPVFLAMTGERTNLTGPALLAARVAVTVALSIASAWLVERPLRTGPVLARPWAAFGLTGGSLAAAAALFAFATVSPSTASLASSSGPAEADALGTGDGPAPVRPPRAPGVPARVVILGDSVGLTIGEGTLPIAGKAGIKLLNHGALGCGVARGGPLRYFGDDLDEPKECPRWPQRWTSIVEKEDPDVVFLVIGRWEVMDRVHAGAWTHIGDPVFDAYLASEIDAAIDAVTVRNARVALATAPYYLRGERPDGGRWPEDDPARVDRFNQLLREAQLRHAETTSIVDLNGKTSEGGRYTRSLAGVQLRSDGVHFTPSGSRWLAPWLFPQLLALAPPVGNAPVTLGPEPGPSTSSSAPPPTSTTSRPRTTATSILEPTTTVPRPTTTRRPTTTAPPTTETTTSTTRPSPTTLPDPP